MYQVDIMIYDPLSGELLASKRVIDNPLFFSHSRNIFNNTLKRIQGKSPNVVAMSFHMVELFDDLHSDEAIQIVQNNERRKKPLEAASLSSTEPGTQHELAGLPSSATLLPF